jgi:ferredoxin
MTTTWAAIRLVRRSGRPGRGHREPQGTRSWPRCTSSAWTRTAGSWRPTSSWRPVDFATDGVFMAGLAHYPKPIEEAVAQAQAAVSRAVTVLSPQGDDPARHGGLPSTRSKCVGCGVCVEVCPYNAIDIDAEDGLAVVNEATCKGCGTCVAACRSGAPNLKGFTQADIMAMVEAVRERFRAAFLGFIKYSKSNSPLWGNRFRL